MGNGQKYYVFDGEHRARLNKDKKPFGYTRGQIESMAATGEIGEGDRVYFGRLTGPVDVSVNTVTSVNIGPIPGRGRKEKGE